MKMDVSESVELIELQQNAMDNEVQMLFIQQTYFTHLFTAHSLIILLFELHRCQNSPESYG
jgi:hypothetical protein